MWEPFSELSVPAHGLRLLLALDIYRVDPQGPAEVDGHDKEDNAAIKLLREGTPPRAAHKEKRTLRPRVLVSPNKTKSLFVITDLSDFRWESFWLLSYV